jgi:hypothetical protein
MRRRNGDGNSIRRQLKHPEMKRDGGDFEKSGRPATKINSF